MTLHTYDFEQRSPEWYDARRGVITASTVGQLITPKTVRPASNDYSRALIATLAAERITGWTEPTFVSWAMQRGIDDEPVARDLYSQHFAPAAEVGFMVEDKWGFRLGLSPDGVVGDDGLLEIKSTMPRKQVQIAVSDEVPLEHVAQCQCALLVTGRQWLDYLSFSAGLPLYVKRVLPDERWHAAIVEAASVAEEAISRMVAEYRTAAAGMPLTMRVPELAEMVI